MKILLFCHLGQIKEYAEYINAFDKVGSVQAVLLTTGDEEYQLGRDVGVFDEVKDILPSQSELDAAELDSSKTVRALRELEARIGGSA